MGKALDLLSLDQRRNIASGLFLVEKDASTKKEMTGCCPFHDDKTPSFSYNPHKDVFFCHGCSASGDLISLWCRIKGHPDGADGFRAFCDAHGIKLQGGPGVRRRRKSAEDELPPLNAVIDSMPVLPESWLVRLAQERGWTKETIQALNIRLQNQYQPKNGGEIRKILSPERVAIPIYDASGAVRNIRLYKPFREAQPEPEPGAPPPKHIPKILSWSQAYGTARLFPPAPRPENPVLLCEGESDTICALSHGFNAITQTTKPKQWSRDQAEKFTDMDVVIAFDADQPGEKYAVEFAAPVLAKVCRSVKILQWPDFMGRDAAGVLPPEKGQDLTDFFMRHRKTVDDLWELIDDAAEYDPLPHITSEAMAFFERGENGRLSFKPRLLAAKLMADTRILSDPESGMLYKWNGRFWEEFSEDHLRNTAIILLGKEADKSRVENAVFQAKMLSTLPHHRKINDQQDWVCVRNGMVNLQTFELHPHDPDYYATYEIPVRFNPDSDRRCDRWLQFLHETVGTPQVIDQIQEFFGYCFTKDTRYQKCLLLLGPGSDGKSQLINLLHELIGPENCSAVSFSGLEDQFQRAGVYQKLLNIATEIGADLLDSLYFKAIVTGDPINAALKHKNQFKFKPYCKLIFSGNRLPKVRDNSDGFFRRLLPVSFKRQFAEDDPDRDPNLPEKLSAELSEIFAWSLVGLHRLRQNGRFTDCTETRDLIFSYRRLNNPVMCFVMDACEVGEEFYTDKKTLYTAYRTYSIANGYSPFAREKFFVELYAAQKTLVQRRTRNLDGNREYVVAGISVIPHADNNQPGLW